MALTPARRQLELAVQYLTLQQCHRLEAVRCVPPRTPRTPRTPRRITPPSCSRGPMVQGPPCPRAARSEAPRTATRTWLQALLAVLPALAWSQPVLDMLLQLLNTLADACDAHYGDEVRPRRGRRSRERGTHARERRAAH